MIAAKPSITKTDNNPGLSRWTEACLLFQADKHIRYQHEAPAKVASFSLQSCLGALLWNVMEPELWHSSGSSSVLSSATRSDCSGILQTSWKSSVTEGWWQRESGKPNLWWNGKNHNEWSSLKPNCFSLFQREYRMEIFLVELKSESWKLSTLWMEKVTLYRSLSFSLSLNFQDCVQS